MVYKIGICDDEEYQIKLNGLYLKELASQNGWEMEYHGFKTGKQVLSFLEKKPLDIVFMDIDLGEESGIQIATQIAAKYPKVIVIFVTGHREFAGEAFEIEAMGYLVKPYDIKKMESILRKALLQISAIQNFDKSKEIVIVDENIKKKIKVDDIIYIQRQISKSVIYTKDKEYNVYETITSIYERIGKNFIRVNQGEIIAMKEISEVKNNVVYLKNGIEMSIGRTYKKQVMESYFGKSANK